MSGLSIPAQFTKFIFAGLHIFLFSSCGGGDTAQTSLDSGLAKPLIPVDSSTALATALLELDSMQPPEGADPDLFADVKLALTRSLKTEYHGSTQRLVSIAPTGDSNIVNDLILSGNDTDGWQLQWGYRNTGDYDQNSEVSVADITPIVIYFGSTSGDANWEDASVADGDSNGEVNLSDVTPIAINFMSSINTYNIYGTSDPEGDWDLVDSFALPSAPAEGRFTLTYDLAAKDYTVYRVTPADSSGTEGSVGEICYLTAEPAETTFGANTVEISTPVGSAGAVITGQPGGVTEIFTLDIPAFAIDEDITISLGSNDGTVMQEGEDLGGSIIKISANSAVVFSQPVILSVDWDSTGDTIPVMYRIHSDGSLSPLALDDVDEDTGKVSWYLQYIGGTEKGTSGTTGDAPDLLWCANAIMELGGDGPYSFLTGFTPIVDGWDTTLRFPHNIGMAAFSIWYFRNYKASMGGLRQNFQDEVASEGEETVIAQDLVASRASIAAYLDMDYYAKQVAKKYTPLHSYAIIRHSLRTSNGPVLISYDGQAVVAIGYYATNFIISDSRNLSAPVIDALALDQYGRSPALLGIASFQSHESFENILLDATSTPPFGGTEAATVNIDSPGNRSIVNDNLVTIKGYVQSGGLLVEELFVWNSKLDESTMVRLLVDESGEFKAVVPLGSGQNKIIFLTRGLVPFLDRIGDPYMSCTTNNFEDGSYMLTYIAGEGTPARASLTWDNPYAYLRLYAYGPGNSPTWYLSEYNMDHDGGILDGNFGAYGPIYFTLNGSEFDPVQYGSDYKLRVHYHIHAPGGPAVVNYQLHVILNEGTSAESTVTSTGSLAVADSSNNYPEDTGPDWGADVFFTPVMP